MLNDHISLGQGQSSQWAQMLTADTAAKLEAAGISPDIALYYSSTSSRSQQDGPAPGLYTSLSGMPSLEASLVQDPATGQTGMRHILNFSESMNTVIGSSTVPQGSNLEVFLQQVSGSIPQEVIQAAQDRGVPPEQLYKGILLDAALSFNQQLLDLPPAEQKRLMVALYEPWGANELSPELKIIFENAKAKMSDDLFQNYGIQMDWSGQLQNPLLDYQITISYDAHFETLLNDAVNSGQVSENDAQTLRSMHYSGVTGPQLGDTLKSLENSAKAAASDEYGLKSDFPFQPASDNYNQILKGAFFENFVKGMDSYLPPPPAAQTPLTADQKAQLLAALSDPGKATPEIKELLETLKSQSIAAVVAQFSLDTNWDPGAVTTTLTRAELQSMQQAQSGLDNAKERLAGLQKELDAVPNKTPEQLAMVNFMQIIGNAINKMQEQVYALQVSQTNIQKEQSRMKLDMEKNSIDRQAAQAAKAQEKHGKMAHMGPLGQILDVIMKVVMVAVACCFGPVALAMTIMFLAKPDLMEKAMQAVSSACKSIAQWAHLPDPAGDVIGSIVNIAASYVLSGGNPMLWLTLVCDKSGPVQTLTKACGGTDADAAIAAAVVQGVVMIAVTVVMMVLTGGAAAPAVAAEVAAMVGTTAARVMTVAKAIMIAFQVAITSMTLAKQGIEINNNILLAQIVMIKAKMEAQAQEIQAMIQIITQLINKLLDLLSGNASELVTLGEFQSGKWDGASQVVSGITAATIN